MGRVRGGRIRGRRRLGLRRSRRLRGMPRVTSSRWSFTYEIKLTGEWELVTCNHVMPDAFKYLWKEFKLLGAYVAVKRNRPSPISFGTGQSAAKTQYAQVEHQELYWAPWSGVDEPVQHPRQVSSAVLVRDDWISRYVSCRVPHADRVLSNRRNDPAGEVPIYEIWHAGPCPWIPMDYSGGASGSDQPKAFPMQSCGFFRTDFNGLEIPVKVDVEVKFRFMFRGRKSIGRVLDETGGIDENIAGDSIYQGSVE